MSAWEMRLALIAPMTSSAKAFDWERRRKGQRLTIHGTTLLRNTGSSLRIEL